MFSLNSLNLVTKIFAVMVKGLKPATQHLLCKRPGCCHSASKIHVRERIFRLNPIYAQVIYQIL